VSEKKVEIADLLIVALDLSIDTGDVYWIGDDIERAISKLDLPVKKCCMCGVEMSYFDWKMKQNM